MRTRHAVAVALMFGGLMLGAGCDAAGESDPTPVRTFKITPASGSPVATTPAATAVATAASTGNEITIAAKNSNLKFDKESITAAAGTVTIVFDNADSGVPHNIQFFEGSDAKGTSVGKTDLESGPVKQTLTMELTPGDYFYHCDAHPTTMKGTLTVT
jgi:plastocyanin